MSLEAIQLDNQPASVHLSTFYRHMLTFRPLTRPELDTAVEWAAAEGWNPGLHDADAFWATDPEGFIGAERQGELVGTGSIVSYQSAFGFMGFFMVRPDLRGQGIGTELWFHRRDLLRSRLRADAAIGMDGVFDMQAWYAQGGFVFSHRNLRLEGIGKEGPRDPAIVTLTEVPFAELAAFDRRHFGCEREGFLKHWIALPDSLALGLCEGKDGDRGRLRGYGVVRRCREGCKIGPLFSEDPDAAESLYRALAAFAPDEPLWLDVPEINADGMALAKRHGLTEVFGCARMYYGPAPELPWNQIYGVSTFELG